MSRIVTTSSIDGFFHDAVDQAIRARHVEVTGGAREYVVSLLSEYAKPDNRAEETLDKSVTLLLSDALQTVDLGERFERLRAVGDGVLYGMGFFGPHFEARGVAPSYLIGVGSRAYGTARGLISTGSSANLEEANPSDVFLELARKFSAFVEILTEVADSWLAHGASTHKGLLKVYERWCKTGSGSLESALRTHGFTPPGTGGTGSGPLS